MYSGSFIAKIKCEGIPLDFSDYDISDSRKSDIEKKELYEYKKKMNIKSMKESIHSMLIEYFKNNISEDIIIKYIINYCDKKTNEEKEGIIQYILRYYPYNIIKNKIILDIINKIHIGGMYTHIHCLLFPKNDLREFMIDEFLQVLNLLLSTGQSPFNRNKLKTDTNPLGETSIEALYISIKNNFIPKKYEEIIYNSLLNINNINLSTIKLKDGKKKNITLVDKIIKSKISKFSSKNSNKICNYFYWCMIINPDIFCENLLDQFKITGSLIKNGIYIPIKNTMIELYDLFSKNPLDDENFNMFFSKHKWDSREYINKFEDIIISKIQECEKDTKDIKYKIDIHGSIIGELNNKEFIETYIYEKLINKDYKNAITCIAHSKIISSRIEDYLKTWIYDIGDIQIKYMLDMIYKEIKGECLILPGKTPVMKFESENLGISPVPDSPLLNIQSDKSNDVGIPTFSKLSPESGIKPKPKKL